VLPVNDNVMYAERLLWLQKTTNTRDLYIIETSHFERPWIIHRCGQSLMQNAEN